MDGRHLSFSTDNFSPLSYANGHPYIIYKLAIVQWFNERNYLSYTHSDAYIERIDYRKVLCSHVPDRVNSNYRVNHSNIIIWLTILIGDDHW